MARYAAASRFGAMIMIQVRPGIMIIRRQAARRAGGLDRGRPDSDPDSGNLTRNLNHLNPVASE